jgi:hypothetical protein
MAEARSMPAQPLRAEFRPPAVVEEELVEKRAEGARTVEFRTRCGPPAGRWRRAKRSKA